MNTKHTPGPWIMETGNFYVSVRAPSRVIGDTRLIGGKPDDENLANARLIAAAPDMLEALEGLLLVEPTTRSDLAWEMLTIHEKARRYDQALERIKSAIAKARGEDA